MSTYQHAPSSPPEGGPPETNLTTNLWKRFLSLLELILSPLTLRVITHVLLALGLVAAIVGASFYFAKKAEELGQDWVANLRPGRRAADDPEPLEPRPRELRPAIKVTDAEKERMQNQLDDIRKKAKHHRDVAVFYYSRFYMAILAFSVSAALAAISLAIISKRGLDKVSEYIVTLFLVATALAVFYQSFPGVFQQRKNVEDNRALYIKYVNLEDDMISYNTTGSIAVVQASPPGEATAGAVNQNGSAQRPSNANNNNANADSPRVVTVGNQYSIITLSPSEFIHYVDYQLKTYNDIAIGFDESKAANFAKEQFKTE
jgi:hypothetical protein